MENQINMGDQNSQQIGQNSMNQPPMILEKPKVNYWMITTIIFGFLFLAISAVFIFGVRFTDKSPSLNSAPSPSIMPTDTNDIRVGDDESYIDFSTCDQWVQYVINKKNFPRQLIHSCKSSQKILDSETVNLVDIFFGPPDDCPSGCIYKRFIGVVRIDKTFIEQLPSGPEGILDSVWAQPPLDTARNYPSFECPSQLEDYIGITLGKLETKYGWNLNFQKPLTCNWEEFDNVKQIVNKRSFTLNGNMFVYLVNGEELWNRDRLIVK